jgi:hypothetical protein
MVPDSQGVLRTVYFSRPTPITVTLAINVYVSAATLANPTAVAALKVAIRTAMTNASQGQPFTLYGNTVTPGQGSQTTLVPGNDFVAEAFRSIAQGQVGVIDVQPTFATLVTSPAPNAQGNVPMAGITQYAVLAIPSNNINVVVFVP